MVSLGQNLALQSALPAAFGEDDGIGVEPVETLSLDVPVSHLIVDLTIVSAIEVHVQHTVFIFIDITQVAGVDENLCTGVHQLLQAGEQLRQAGEFSSNACSIHQQEKGVETFLKTLIEDIDALHIGNATLFHRFTTQGRYINSRDVKTTLLQGQGMATATLAATTDDTEFFAHIDGIGPEKSAAVVGWFHDAGNNASAARLLDLLEVEEEKTEAAGTRCAKLTFVITGDVHHSKNRNELKAYIESQGGKVTGSVSKSTNFLINNDTASMSSKNKKAHELNIPIISEEEFIQRFGE